MPIRPRRTVRRAAPARATRAVPAALAEKLARLPRPLHLLLDFDGTLAPIAREPRLARLPLRTRLALARLAKLPGVHLGVISARPLAQLARKVRLPRITHVGLYGLEEKLPGARPVRLPLEWSRRRWVRLSRALERATAGTGALIERKPPAVAVHDRGLTRTDAAAVRRAVRSVVRDEPRFEIRPGSRVLEVVPRGLPDKGDALERIMRREPSGSFAYFGDSAADEPAFRAVRAAGGVGVRVAEKPGRSAATERLADPDELARTLEALLRRLEPRARRSA